MNKRLWYCGMGVLTVLLVALDQWTKMLAVRVLYDAPDVVLIPQVLQFHYLQNTGAAFSLLKGQSIVFFVLTPVLCAGILYVFFRTPVVKRFYPVHICCAFLLAGAIGNYIDRVSIGSVTDFIYFSLIDFPVFNVADIYVTCAMIVLVVLMLFVYKEDDFEQVFPKGRDRI
ncbi:MAG: signal peptidase II [Lachnospiraceae bacterium]|nr:signal peptidase II [Lachnospiraceae bacterium]